MKVLGRNPDTQGLNDWVKARAVNQISDSDLIVDLLLSFESQTADNNQSGFDGLLVTNRFGLPSVDDLYMPPPSDF
jgi:hypothetical protein